MTAYLVVTERHQLPASLGRDHQEVPDSHVGGEELELLDNS